MILFLDQMWSHQDAIRRSHQRHWATQDHPTPEARARPTSTRAGQGGEESRRTRSSGSTRSWNSPHDFSLCLKKSILTDNQKNTSKLSLTVPPFSIILWIYLILTQFFSYCCVREKRMPTYFLFICSYYC